MTIKKKNTFKRIAEMEEGEVVITFLLVDTISIRKKSDGDEFMSIRFKDSTGSVEGKIWEGVDRYKELEVGDVAKIEAEVKTYRNKLDLNVKQLRLLEDRDREEGFEDKWLEEWSEYDIDELWERLIQMVDRIESEPIRMVMHSILGAKEEKLRRVPAARSLHHSYFGGLLEHTVWITDNCLRLLDNYKELDRDLIIAGAILHDIGKTEELGGQRVTDYTVEGRLIGHIIQGRDILRRHAKLIKEFPKDTLMHLEHIILAHQGEREWGSPIMPATPEAFFIHMMDNLDAKLRMFLYTMKNAPDDKTFTDYHRTLARYIYLGRPETGEEEEGEET